MDGGGQDTGPGVDYVLHHQNILDVLFKGSVIVCGAEHSQREYNVHISFLQALQNETATAQLYYSKDRVALLALKNRSVCLFDGDIDHCSVLHFHVIQVPINLVILQI